MSRAPSRPTVFVVDDDAAMRESLEFLFDSVDVPTEAFASAADFLAAYDPPRRGCLLLDVRMPGMSGLELQQTLAEQRLRIPVVIMTGHADVPMAVRAMRAGAVDFIEKPFNEELLLARVRKALDRDDEIRRGQQKVEPIRHRLDELTPREREVMELVVEGLLNKQIAARLGLSMKTVEQHRSRVMNKMAAGSLAELVRMALRAGIDPGEA